jgi:hypothetical protein
MLLPVVCNAAASCAIIISFVMVLSFPAVVPCGIIAAGHRVPVGAVPVAVVGGGTVLFLFLQCYYIVFVLTCQAYNKNIVGAGNVPEMPPVLKSM